MKTYRCTWGAGYVSTNSRPIVEEHDLEFFTEAKGYRPKDIRAVKRLEVGQTWTDDAQEVHTVQRLA
jgi:hypothetical protein